MTETIHQCARVSRYLIVVTAEECEPRINRGLSSGKLIGDGVTLPDWQQVRAAAIAERERCDATGERLWVWIGHDQYFYHSDWQFFLCFGPEGWVSDAQRRSIHSTEELHRLAAIAKEEDRKEGEKRKQAAKLVPRNKRKKQPRRVDAIAAYNPDDE